MSTPQFDSLIGLDSAKRVIRRLITGAGTTHAVLFYGARGSGKNTLAQLLAQAWLCTHPTEQGPDGECRACGSFSRASNSDFLAIRPEGPSRIIHLKAIAPTGTRSPDDPHHVQEFLRTLPLVSRHKVVLIEDADRMNGAAYNALLKTLEEPLPHAKLILTTPQIGALPATILSRCLALACESPTEAALKAMFPDAAASEIALAEGTPGRFLTIRGHREVFGKLVQFALRLPSRSPAEALVAVEELRSIAEALDDATGMGARSANAEVVASLATLLTREVDAPPEWTQILAEAHRRIVGNGNAGLVLDAALAQMLLRR